MATYRFRPEIAWNPPEPEVSYNSTCDDDYPRSTLAQLRTRLLARLGMAAMPAGLPGMTELLNDFLQQAQEMLYRRYDVFRTERFFAWPMQKGVRFYDLPDNADECTKKLDPRKVRWVGVEDGASTWRELQQGIPPELYSGMTPGYPARYEIRQCIEVWPAPADDSHTLRIKGHFGLLPFTEDEHYTTIDAEAVFLLALANAKAHYGQPDAANYMQQLNVYIGDLVAGTHMTARYIPGGRKPRVPEIVVRQGEP